jgi:two-component system nitrate/nitrite response regulator NarP
MSHRHAIDVVVADKSPLVVTALKALLAADKRFNLLATASDGGRFLDAVGSLRFDVGIIGWDMPFKGGRDVLEALKGREDGPRVVIYTGEGDPAVPREAMTLGAAAFCSKGDPPERLLDVVAAVADGSMVFPYLDLSKTRDDPLAALTGREHELLAALGSGRTNAELARALGISTNTVKFHLRNLFDKIGVRNRAQAVALWAERPR